MRGYEPGEFRGGMKIDRATASTFQHDFGYVQLDPQAERSILKAQRARTKASREQAVNEAIGGVIRCLWKAGVLHR